MRQFSALLIIIFGTVSQLLSAQPQLAFSLIDTKHGLSDNQIRNIAQLTDGRMMIITDGVVNLFDGTSFSQLHLKPGCTYSLTGYKGLHHSYIDGNRVWIKNYQQLMLIDTNLEDYVVNPDSVLSQMGISEKIADLFIDEAKTYWIRTISDKLLCLGSNDRTPRLFRDQVSYPEGKQDELYDVAVVKDQVFLFYSNGLMLCCDLKNGYLLYKSNALLEDDRPLFNRTLLVVQHDDNLYTLRNGRKGIMQVFNTLDRSWRTVITTDYWLNTLTLDQENRIWLSCHNGLWIIDKYLNNKQLIPSFQLVDGTDVTTEASTLFNDRQGGFWIGTFNHGLLYYHTDRFKFVNLGRPFFNSTGEDITIDSFAEYAKGQFIIATNKGMYIYNSNESTIHPAPGILNELRCYKLQEIENHIIATTPNGIAVIEKPSLNLQKIPTINFQTVIPVDKQQILGYNTQNEWFSYYPENNKLKIIASAQKNSNLQWISKLIWIDSSTVLGLGNIGLFSFDLKTQQFSYPFEERQNNNHPQYTDMIKDRKGLVWIGTKDGLMVCDSTLNIRDILHKEDGLVNNCIKAITEDKQGNIWVSTSCGISRISVTLQHSQMEFTIANFNHFDGVIENEFIEGSIYLSSNGLLLLGGINGMNIIDLNKPWKFQQLQKPVFTSFKLFGNEVKPGAYNNKKLLTRTITATDTVILSYNQNFITLGFSALNFVNPSQTYYRVQMMGVENQWREIASPNGTAEATYTNLSPGTYLFKVKAANNSKNWSTDTATLTLIIQPPWWKTSWAYAVYFVIVVLGTWLILSYYKQRTLARIERQNEEKLNKLKFTFFTNISHEFRTPLTLIITPLESVLKEIKGLTIENTIHSVYNNAQELLNLVNQLLDFRRLEAGGEKLNLTFGSLTSFVLQHKQHFDNIAEEKEIDFSFNSQHQELLAYFDSNKLHVILNNLISNAVKFTPPKGEITIQLNQQANKAIIQIIDNGKGISNQDIPFIFDRFYQASDIQGGSGIGLHLVKEYVDLHYGSIEVTSTPNVETIFSVKLPLDLKPEIIENESIAIPSTSKKIPIMQQSEFKLLVVEDNDELRHFLCSELNKSYNVIEAADGIEALNLAKMQMPDLIISDVMMPQMDGLDLCRSIKSDMKTSHIPIILLTARVSQEHQLLGYESGADDYLSKPFSVEILLLRISKLIEIQKFRQQKFTEKIEVNPREITITSLDVQLIQKALNCIEKNMANANYSVQQLSNDLFMDRTVLYKKLQTITGLAPSEFIRSIRLKRAAQLLVQGQYPVAEVSELVGFNTQKYFTKYFKEAFGLTPSQYAHQGENKPTHKYVTTNHTTNNNQTS